MRSMREPLFHVKQVKSVTKLVKQEVYHSGQTNG